MNNLEKAKQALVGSQRGRILTQAKKAGLAIPYPGSKDPQDMNINDIAAFIREERHRLGWSQRDLAKKANCSQGTITRAENHMWISLRCLVDIALAFNKKLTIT